MDQGPELVALDEERVVAVRAVELGETSVEPGGDRHRYDRDELGGVAPDDGAAQHEAKLYGRQRNDRQQ